MPRISLFGAVFLLVYPIFSFAIPDSTELAVWANEAIVATYSYNYKNYVTRQREIAKFFTSDGWIAYTTALNASKLPNVVMKNAYYVSAVALAPPKIDTINAHQWQASMPLLVIYKNPQYQQKQTLQVMINFSEAPKDQGVRGLSINNLESKVIEPPCECQPK